MTEIVSERSEESAGGGELPAWASTKFGAWVVCFTVPQLSREMLKRGHEISVSGIYYWLRGDTVPRPDKAQALVAISAGMLTMEDIYSHVHAMRVRKA